MDGKDFFPIPYRPSTSCCMSGFFKLLSALVIFTATHSLELANAFARQLNADKDKPALVEVEGDTGKRKANVENCAGFESAYPPGLNLVQLPAIGRQFLLAVPKTRVPSASGS